MPKVIIDEKEYEVAEGRNMLQAVIDCGLNLPYFCWHPAMGSVGACRLCAVRVYKDENDTKGKIAMACMTPAKDGTRISINDPEAAEFRRYVIEWLMTNHPHDCPVCDEGGECHLQDMTTMCGQVYRRFRFSKRYYTNQNLGPFVTHEMNRCIQCYRCVRFYRDMAGGRDFNFFGSRNRVYFGRETDGVLESEFSGNLVEVCPTGVFTDKTSARHYTRKWDLQTAPSICTHCGLGCNIIPGSRYGSMRRVTARFNGDVNGYFLCDRGRFGYEFANVARPGVEPNDAQITRAKEMLLEASGVIGIGSPRASLESNYALQNLVSSERFCSGLSDYDQQGIEFALHALKTVRTPSLAEVELCDVILILGVDPTNEAPMLDFAIRQAMRKAPLDIARKLNIPDWDAHAVRNALQNAKGDLYIAAPWSLKIGEIAKSAVDLSLRDVADMVDRLVGRLDGESDPIASALVNAHKPLIVTGISAGVRVMSAATRLAQALCARGKDCGLFVTVPEANTMGIGMLGGFSVDEAARRVEAGLVDTLVVLENDLSRRIEKFGFEHLLANVKKLIVLDCIETATTAHADLALRVPNVFESDGTFVSNEGRAQRFYAVSAGRKPTWAVLQELAGEEKWFGFEDVLKDLATEMPEFGPALDAAPSADWRSAAKQKVARDSHRFTGRTAKDAGWTIREPQSPQDSQTPLAFSMEGDQNPPPSPLIPRFWWPGWNSNEAINKFQIEVGGGLHGGNPGKRLIEPSACCVDQPTLGECPTLGDGEVWLVPKPFIYGSEELSCLAKGIHELIPEAKAAMHPDLAAKLGIGDGQTVRIDTDDRTLYLSVSVDECVALDTVVVPFCFDETIGIVAPSIARVR